MAEGITVLAVTEEIKNQHGPILKAGISKLFQSGKKTLLLDLTSVTQVDEGIAKEVQEIIHMAPEMDAQIIVVSPIDGIGQAPSRDIAIKQMQSALFGLLATEAKLQAKLRLLEQKKNQFIEKLNGMKTGEVDVLSLRKENGELKKRAQELEKGISKFLSKREDVKYNQMLTDRFNMVTKTLNQILTQDGVVQMGSS
ncbi:MAG: hypothetical protein A2583_13285 [Bdellovibrionales bacterium RIFOXYD1_FULL_53_11]|nr:MAG: hypothetical protein A2583_13285 [Bdellovibrionales bacterium RIFOXYD1_FULL_53_11]